MRAIAQMISYEVPLILSAVTVVMMAGSLSTVKIVEAQAGYTGAGCRNWYVFTPWGLAGFVLFLIAAAGGIQPLAFRSARGRIRNYRRVLHRILRVQVRAVLPGGIHRDVRHQRTWHHAVPGRLARAVRLPDWVPS